MKIDPILAVNDVEKSAQWYQSVFDWKSIHGGKTFDVLTDQEGEVMLCLHKWGEHDHPSMISPGLSVGNGLILYFRTSKIDEIRKNITELAYAVDAEIDLNPNSGMKEFSLKDVDGYSLIISEYHEYQG